MKSALSNENIVKRAVELCGGQEEWERLCVEHGTRGLFSEVRLARAVAAGTVRPKAKQASQKAGGQEANPTVSPTGKQLFALAALLNCRPTPEAIEIALVAKGHSVPWSCALQPSQYQLAMIKLGGLHRSIFEHEKQEIAKILKS